MTDTDHDFPCCDRGEHGDAQPMVSKREADLEGHRLFLAGRGSAARPVPGEIFCSVCGDRLAVRDAGRDWIEHHPDGSHTHHPSTAWIADAEPTWSPAPTDDEREALARLDRLALGQGRDRDGASISTDLALVLAMFRRQPPTPSPAPPARDARAMRPQEWLALSDQNYIEADQ